jgi:hypothetical protein
MMTKLRKTILLSASIMFFPVCTGCNDTIEEALVSGITTSVCDIITSIITDLAQGVFDM